MPMIKNITIGKKSYPIAFDFLAHAHFGERFGLSMVDSAALVVNSEVGMHHLLELIKLGLNTGARKMKKPGNFEIDDVNELFAEVSPMSVLKDIMSAFAEYWGLGLPTEATAESDDGKKTTAQTKSLKRN